MNALEQPKARIIENTLRNPFPRRIARILAANMLKDDLRDFLELVHDLHNLTEMEWVKNVEELARIDLDMSQMSHRNEILQISR